MKPPALRLYSVGLLSKWGFSDGDIPEELMDYWDSIDFEYPDGDWHDVLRKLVRTYLLPELDKNHEIRVIDIETSHNPIRAEYVNGVEVDWYRSNPSISLAPEYVEIAYDAVMAAFQTEKNDK